MSSWMKVSKISSTPEPERIIEHAFLQCRNIHDDIPEAWAKKELWERIEWIMEHGHFSVLEHASATFSIRGVSRSFLAQLTRHRLAAYSVVSTRQVPREKFHLIIPPSIEERMDLLPAYKNVAGLCAALYENLLTEGIEMEDAMFILPMGTETQVVMTCNFREWLHVLRMRLGKHAKWEIKEVANEIWQQLQDISPNVFDPKYREFWE